MGDDFDTVMAEFYDGIRSGRGALFLAVCRGKVGPQPYPNAGPDPKAHHNLTLTLTLAHPALRNSCRSSSF